MDDISPEIKRHRTALQRGDLSRPVKRALSDGLISPSVTVFDYGCGRGGDLEQLDAQGIACRGWDPAFRPNSELAPADVVNLGFVLNVIEEPIERAEALRRSWELAGRVLVVSAQVHVSSRGKTSVPYGDGVVTARATFQKFFDQGELKAYIESELGTEAVPAEPGIFYVFRSEAAREQFSANRYRRRVAAPRKKVSELRFEENRELLESFMSVIATLGRLPEADEFLGSAEVQDRLGSLTRAFSLVKRVTGTEEWETITQRRSEDLLVYLALGKFRRRPPISVLPIGLQRDIRAYFGSYSNACRLADDLLFKAGNAEAVDEDCRKSPVGKLLPAALYVHRSALDSLSSLLRVYEGCARAYLGEIEGANLVKLHCQSGKVSYLSYPDFETDPHPCLMRSVSLNLRTREIYSSDYSKSSNRPILHRKETFLLPEDPLFEKFGRLTQQEEKNELLLETNTIGTRDGWNERLREKGFTFKGHRLVKRAKDTSPEVGG